MVSKVITSTKWAPDRGIAGNSKGVFTFTSTVSLRVVSFGLDQMYPAGTHRIKVDRIPPTAPGSLTHTFIFYRGSQRIWTHTFKILSQPLVSMRWIPKFPFDKNALIKSGEGTLKIDALGVQNISIPQFNFSVNAPPGGRLDIPLNLPPDITNLVRNEFALYVELFIRAKLLADGKEKNVIVKTVFG